MKKRTTSANKVINRTKPEAKVEQLIDETCGKVYLPPCQIACPIGENIQRTNVLISILSPDEEEARGCVIDIGDELYEENPLFTICGYICGLCEKECNYKDKTGAIRRRLLKRFVSDYYMPYLDIKPAFPKATKEKVAVVGGGPGGLMAAYMLGKKGYRVTVLERGKDLGGAVRSIPRYRLSRKVLDSTVNNLARIANAEVKYGAKVGQDGESLADLAKEGYKAVFIATGTPLVRQLTFGRDPVPGANLDGVKFGLDLLWDVSFGHVSGPIFKGKRVVVVGGGNVAFDVARTARRLGGDVQVVCLENADKSTKDGIPADVEEIEAALEEGIRITYSRGVQEVIGEDGKFKKIKCPKCVSVFDEKGFNPKFDTSDVIYLEGDVLLVTIGQGAERAFLQKEDLLSDRGRLDVDAVTLMSNRKPGVFIGGDVLRVGFAAEAMRDGEVAAESIDRYLKGEDLKAGRAREYEKALIPLHQVYKEQPELKWRPAEERLDFEMFEKGLTLDEAIEEARRCLCCGPCRSCKGCVLLGLQPEIAEIVVTEELCSGCGTCVAVCPFDAVHLKKVDDDLISEIDLLKCKRCGLCVSTCPSAAITIKDAFAKAVGEALKSL